MALCSRPQNVDLIFFWHKEAQFNTKHNYFTFYKYVEICYDLYYAGKQLLKLMNENKIKMASYYLFLQ
jgi:hypothetical protein